MTLPLALFNRHSYHTTVTCFFCSAVAFSVIYFYSASQMNAYWNCALFSNIAFLTTSRGVWWNEHDWLQPCSFSPLCNWALEVHNYRIKTTIILWDTGWLTHRAGSDLWRVYKFSFFLRFLPISYGPIASSNLSCRPPIPLMDEYVANQRKAVAALLPARPNWKWPLSRTERIKELMAVKEVPNYTPHRENIDAAIRYHMSFTK